MKLIIKLLLEYWIKSDNGLHDHLLEVDLDYPESKHEYYNDYPLAPEKIKL